MLKLSRALLPALLLVPLIGCDAADGPAERAGQRVDRAAERVRDAVDPPSGPGERLGRAVDRATD